MCGVGVSEGCVRGQFSRAWWFSWLVPASVRSVLPVPGLGAVSRRCRGGEESGQPAGVEEHDPVLVGIGSAADSLDEPGHGFGGVGVVEQQAVVAGGEPRRFQAGRGRRAVSGAELGSEDLVVPRAVTASACVKALRHPPRKLVSEGAPIAGTGHHGNLALARLAPLSLTRFPPGERTHRLCTAVSADWPVPSSEGSRPRATRSRSRVASPSGGSGK
jgi:hypothetical protein